MVADVSAITYFAPIAAFLVVFLVAFAILHKSRLLGDLKWVNLFVSLVLAALFISVAACAFMCRPLRLGLGHFLSHCSLFCCLWGSLGAQIRRMDS